jgi:hypothetical protein
MAAYRKHHLDDPSIGWDELGNILQDAICNEIGDADFVKWLDGFDTPLEELKRYKKSEHWKQSTIIGNGF